MNACLPLSMAVRGRQCTLPCHPRRQVARRPGSGVKPPLEFGFGFTSLMLPCALKPLFTMALRRSNKVLRISTVGLFCAISPSHRFRRPWRRATHAKPDPSDCLNHPQFRHFQACAQDCPICRGGAVAQIQYDRSAHCNWHNRPARTLPQGPPCPHWVRIAKEPESTLLHVKHAPYTSISCSVPENMRLIPGNWQPLPSRAAGPLPRLVRLGAVPPAPRPS